MMSAASVGATTVVASSATVVSSLSAAVVSSAAEDHGAINVTMGTVTGAPGEEVLVPVYVQVEDMQGAEGLVNFQARFDIPEGLSLNVVVLYGISPKCHIGISIGKGRREPTATIISRQRCTLIEGHRMLHNSRYCCCRCSIYSCKKSI